MTEANDAGQKATDQAVDQTAEGDTRVGLDAVPLQRRSGQIRWSALALEAVVVVGSILLAFTLDSWWQDRERDQMADELRAALVVDFARNRTSIDSVILAVEKKVTTANDVLLREVLVRDGDVSVDSLVTGYLALASFVPFLTTNGTYRAAVSSGDVRLLRNDSLTIALADYQEYHDFLSIQDQQIEEVILNGAFARGSLEMGGLIRLTLSLQTPQAEWTREEFRARLAQPEVMAGIESVFFVEQTRLRLLRGLRGRIDRILALLGEDLAKAVDAGKVKAPPPPVADPGGQD